jgi:dTDP-L-rhamnose 4-epimerase
MRALVTGGAGFIGSHIADALLARGYRVRILDNLDPRVHPRGRPTYLRPEFEFIHGDVRDRAALERALAEVDAVFHQAAYQECAPEYSEFFRTNVVGTALLYEIIREKKLPIRKIVMASSQSVYGEGQYRCLEHGILLPEGRSVEQLDRGEWEVRCPHCQGPVVPVLLREAWVHPAGPYGVSRIAQEMLGLQLGKLLGIPTVALRYSVVQGARQSFYSAYSDFCRLLTRALRRRCAPIIFEDGRQLRDYVHVADVVAANLVVLDDPRANGQAFNVGSGRATAVFDYACLLRNKMKMALDPEIPGAYRVGDARHTVSSVTKLEALGWKAVRGLDEIFADYLAWLDATPESVEYFREGFDAMRGSGVVRRVGRMKESAIGV